MRGTARVGVAILGGWPSETPACDRRVPKPIAPSASWVVFFLNPRREPDPERPAFAVGKDHDSRADIVERRRRRRLESFDQAGRSGRIACDARHSASTTREPLD